METFNLDELSEEQKINAVKAYYKSLYRIKIYNVENKEKINEKSRKNFQKIKNNPEKYEIYKQRAREKYHKKKALKQQQQNVEITNTIVKETEKTAEELLREELNKEEYIINF